MTRFRISNAATERRSKVRFPLVREVRYEFEQSRHAHTGQGETLNISSSGVLIQTEHELEPGTKLQMAISWPMKLNETASIKLVVDGKIVWAEQKRAAVQFGSHEFRLLGCKL